MQVPVQVLLQQNPSMQLPLRHWTPHPQASPRFLPRDPSSLVQATGWSELPASPAWSLELSIPASRVGVLVFEQVNASTNPEHTSKTLTADRRCRGIFSVVLSGS